MPTLVGIVVGCGVFLIITIFVATVLLLKRRGRREKTNEHSISLTASHSLRRQNSTYASQFFENLKFEDIWEIDFNEIVFG